MKLEVIKDGIYPIRFNERNEEVVQPKYKIEQLVQTKGTFYGAPTLFLNLGLCNLKCVKREAICNNCFKKEVEKLELETQVVANIIRNNIGNIKHLVITGGEPLLQSTALLELFSLIKDLNLLITLETNGTIYNEEVYSEVDYISIFPVLSAFSPTQEKVKRVRSELKEKMASMSKESVKKHEQERVNIRALQIFIDNCILDAGKVFTFNVYVLSVTDIVEFKNEFLNKLKNWVPEDVNIIYYGIKPSIEIVNRCVEEGFNFSTITQYE